MKWERVETRSETAVFVNKEENKTEGARAPFSLSNKMANSSMIGSGGVGCRRPEEN